MTRVDMQFDSSALGGVEARVLSNVSAWFFGTCEVAYVPASRGVDVRPAGCGLRLAWPNACAPRALMGLGHLHDAPHRWSPLISSRHTLY